MKPIFNFVLDFAFFLVAIVINFYNNLVHFKILFLTLTRGEKWIYAALRITNHWLHTKVIKVILYHLFILSSTNFLLL